MLSTNNVEHEQEALERKEGLEYLLGGLDIDTLSPSAWENESDTEKQPDELMPQTQSLTTPYAESRNNSHLNTLSTSRVSQVYDQDPLEVEVAFRNAYTCSGYCTPYGRTEKPPVQIVVQPGRGKALIATKHIPKGQTLYTERAAVATQLPNAKVRACKHCFRSMEPASSVVAVQNTTQEDDNSGDAETEGSFQPAVLPHSRLWPVRELDFSEGKVLHFQRGDEEQGHRFQNATKLQVDRFQRLHCTECSAWFCHEYCLKAHESEVGDHCLCRKALELLTGLYAEQEDDMTAQVQAPVALATRMFATAIHKLRINAASPSASPSQSLEGDSVLADGYWRGLCGSAQDVTPLELGFSSSESSNNNGVQTFTLKPIYDRLVQLYSLSPEEQDVLSLDLLMTFCAMAARNGFGMRTQSPFASYYNALIRQAGGRGTEAHESLKQHVAKALGSPSGKLERGMDRKVEDQVAPEIVVVFALTARINHSCFFVHPYSSSTSNDNSSSTMAAVNAEVTSQVFMDCHMDLVATRDIFIGDEIQISYLGQTRRKSTAKRKRELWAKYLFDCKCPECQ